MVAVSEIEVKKDKKKVAAYARVSTLMEQQEESYETQRKYYETLIRNHPEWEFSGIFADRGISGTQADKRTDFMRMMEAARNGKIDIILCKSISRFSRNVVDTQRYVHELKSLQVEVLFEKEGISSFDGTADMIFSIMASVAEMESRSISENVKWGVRRRQEAGTFHVGSNHMLGYDEIDGKLTPNQDAWIVKLIFEEYAQRIPISDIIRHLSEKGANRMRSKRQFTISSIYAILENEAYIGDRKYQKAPPKNYLTHKPDSKNTYTSKYLYDEHEAIVPPYLWNAVVERMDRERAETERGIRRKSNSHFLYGKVICGECGEPYRRHGAKDKNGYYKTWRCRGRVNGTGCHGRHIREDELMAAIVRKMGWENGVLTPEGLVAFDEIEFEESVDEVIVKPDTVNLVMKKGWERKIAV